ncbi:MAG: YtxH domain-containing protein [Cytophagaceae bacterium]|jgi:gas vesicle protein|nr:YtxH domain-containing protein [Cytophagaceae bacterium]
MAQDENKWMTFLGGVAVGALVGILFAPDKGSVTRAKLMEQLQTYAAELQDILNKQSNSIDSDPSTSSIEVEAKKIMEEMEKLMQQIKA